jgi:hypothetical protein
MNFIPLKTQEVLQVSRYFVPLKSGRVSFISILCMLVYFDGVHIL